MILYFSISFKSDTPVCFFLFKILFIFGHRRRKRNVNVWLSLKHPLLGTWPATQTCALTGNRTRHSLICRLAVNHWATPARAMHLLQIRCIVPIQQLDFLCLKMGLRTFSLSACTHLPYCFYFLCKFYRMLRFLSGWCGLVGWSVVL